MKNKFRSHKTSKPTTKEDLMLFHEAIKGTQKLSHNKIKLNLKKPKVDSSNIINKINEETTFLDVDLPNIDNVQSEQYILYKDSSISNKILRNLRKGQYNVEAILDLHGYTVEEAKGAINHFLTMCDENNFRVILIIHGKGKNTNKPILKNKLNHWLRRSHAVLAFCSAQIKHGGSGALYVLLKRKNR